MQVVLEHITGKRRQEASWEPAHGEAAHGEPAHGEAALGFRLRC